MIGGKVRITMKEHEADGSTITGKRVNGSTKIHLSQENGKLVNSLRMTRARLNYFSSEMVNLRRESRRPRGLSLTQMQITAVYVSVCSQSRKKLGTVPSVSYAIAA